MMASIAVIGAGVVGLSCAVQIQDAVPGCKVTVIADKFGKDTCSDGAAGMFRPTIGKTPGTEEEKLRKWLRATWDHFDRLVHSPDGADAGMLIVAGYQFTDSKKQTGFGTDFNYDHRLCTEREMNMFPGAHYRQGFRVTTLMTECCKYLPYLMKLFCSQGGNVESRTVKSLHELVRHYDVLVVCTGFRSKYLLDDPTVYCNRGHLIRVRAPWLKQFIYSEDAAGNTTYIYPGADTVAVGGTRQRGDEDVAVREHEHTAIWERACHIMPSLKAATFLWDWVGLRPYREPLRLEADVLRYDDNGSIPVVYNYGHGGDGVSLSWGTAMEATQLVLQQLAKTSTHSKL